MGELIDFGRGTFPGDGRTPEKAQQDHRDMLTLWIRRSEVGREPAVDLFLLGGDKSIAKQFPADAIIDRALGLADDPAVESTTLPTPDNEPGPDPTVA